MPQDISLGPFMPSASFLQAFPAAHGELQSSGGGQSLSLPSSPLGECLGSEQEFQRSLQPGGILGAGLFLLSGLPPSIKEPVALPPTCIRLLEVLA